MAPNPGGRGGGWGGGGGGGDSHGRRKVQGVRQGSEEIKKFLSFYKRKNSLCVDLYLPAFYQKKPSYEDLAEFVYTVLSVGGTSSPHLIRAGVLDIQLHPVKKLLFIKFNDQKLRDEVVGRLQAGLAWPAFDTTVTGWSMDKPVERFRVLGTSPETDEAWVRQVLGQYGEILDAQKGFISKKLPGCTNGIWTVRMLLKAGMSLPPFLIMKDEGEVWQLATGEASVCWKCGQHGHIGDKCRQVVNFLAESIASPAVGSQPSWAHVVKGGISVAPPAPPPPPPCHPLPIAMPISSDILRAAKASLKVVKPKVYEKKTAEVPSEDSEVAKNGPEHNYAQLLSPAMEVVDKDNIEGFVAEQACSSDPLSESASGQQHKKARLSEDLTKSSESESEHLSTSPILHHKELGGLRQQHHHDQVDGGVHTNMFGVNYIMWFDLSIEGKSPMDPQEEDWGGKLEFGFSDKNFPKDLEDYFLLFEDECTTQSHSCAGRVMGVLFNMRGVVLNPPSYDQRNVVDLLDKYRDGHIIDSGWREVDSEKWVA